MAVGRKQFFFLGKGMRARALDFEFAQSRLLCSTFQLRLLVDFYTPTHLRLDKCWQCRAYVVASDIDIFSSPINPIIIILKMLTVWGLIFIHNWSSDWIQNTAQLSRKHCLWIVCFSNRKRWFHLMLRRSHHHNNNKSLFGLNSREIKNFTFLLAGACGIRNAKSRDTWYEGRRYDSTGQGLQRNCSFHNVDSSCLCYSQRCIPPPSKK